MKSLFITATDTDAGKTFIASALTQALISVGLKVATFKPIAAGCEKLPNSDNLINDDAKLLTHFANAGQSIHCVNPITFIDPIAPHIAAQHEGTVLTIDTINHYFNEVKSCNADITITEGAGGWRLPIHVNEEKQSYLSEFVQQHEMQVILVVNMKLGCLNHAMLTFEAIKADGLKCIAWVANNAEHIPMSNLTENLTSLKAMLPIPNIGVIAHYTDSDVSGQTLSLHDKVNLASQQLNVKPILQS